ncbi:MULTISPECIES: LAGLIDADG family homing endonuclease [Ramlibacter]|uniref:Ribonucleoside reductase n=1 Tax=Ramlibacter aquaticus TaxID=2780094 RepID=A0ABR9SFH4_9BURK|nr:MULTISPECIES: LAGLIDADG family homing endonuclease [Ramlibacter]MBE7941097.1 ribonucleoside reductase [Ramlibacter aquaticus]
MVLALANITREPQPITREVLREKYCHGAGEATEADIFGRVARAAAAVEKTPALRAEWEQRFVANMFAGAIGAGRIMASAGLDNSSTWINCFVQPVSDTAVGLDEDGVPGIYMALAEAGETLRRGGGVGYNFSAIRPQGALVRGTQTEASGPCTFMDVFDASCRTVAAAGNRRGAQMGMLDDSHPDIFDFIQAKRTKGRWNNFNVSVGVSDAFMQAVLEDRTWELVHKAAPGARLIAAGAHQRSDGLWVYRTVRAREMWDTMMHSAYDFAEPGIIFLGNINRDNNLRAIENIRATNPCVTADTWVLTSQGARQVRQLIGRPFEAMIHGRAYATSSQGFFPTGLKPVVALRLRGGQRLRLTADHRVRRVTRMSRWVRQEAWCPAGRLEPGDRVVLHDHRELAGWQGAGTEGEGYLLGLLLGDGTLKADKAVLSVWDAGLQREANGGVHLSESVRGIMQAAEAAVRALGHRADFQGWMPVAGRNEFRLSTAYLGRLAAGWGMAPGDKHLSLSVEQSSSDFHAGFLRGLFDADGSVQGSQRKGVSVRLSQSSLETLESVQRMLLRLGIASTLYANRRPAGRRPLPDGHGGQGAFDCKASHELAVSGDNLPLFAQRVGFADTGKQQRLSQALASYRRTLNRERFVAEVESVVPDGEESVYDVGVSQVHAFDANGLVVHNCGEQPLPPYGCCDLGPIILPRFVSDAFTPEAKFDMARFVASVKVQVRFLDNVLTATPWPLAAQQRESEAKRRIGVGFTGLGNALAMLGLPYGSAGARDWAANLAEQMRNAAYEASVDLAQEKGAFPLFDAERYLEEGTFASRLPQPLKARIRKHGLRNSHLLSIAPTGTVSLAFADNASNGIEPPFSFAYSRNKRMPDGSTKKIPVLDHGFRVFLETLPPEVAEATLDDAVNFRPLTGLPASMVSALSLSCDEHLAMMGVVQPFIDTAISKTVNVPADLPFEAFKDLYLTAHRLGLKGCATYRPNEILGAVLELPTGAPAPSGPATPAVRDLDPLRVPIERRPEGELASVTEKVSYWTTEGKKSLYLVVSFAEVDGVLDGRPVRIQRPIEVFMPANQSDEAQQWVTAAMRLMSLMAREGRLPKALADLRKIAWDKGPVRFGHYEKPDGTRVPRWHDSEVAAIAYAVQQILFRRGFLDADGGVVPARMLAQRPPVQGELLPVAPPELAEPAGTGRLMSGKKCPECGAHAVIKKDGCEFCTACGAEGACG